MSLNIESTCNRNDLSTSIIQALKHANVFFTEHYAKLVLSDRGTIYYLYNENYVIPISVFRRSIFHWACFTSEMFVLSKNPNQSEAEFLESCIFHLKKALKIQWIGVNPAYTLFPCYPKDSKRIPFGSHVIDLTLSEEQLWANIHGKHRNSIRKAKKSDVIIRYGGIELLNDYYEMDRETWGRSGYDVNHGAHHSRIINILQENAVVFIAYKDNVPNGGAILYYNPALCYYMFGASKNSPEPGSMNLLHWEAIKYMKGCGVLEYSFVGCRIQEDENSKYHNIQRFKERFGGELKRGYLFKLTLNRPMYLLYKLAIGIITKKFQHYDAIDQEISKWQDLQKETK